VTISEFKSAIAGYLGTTVAALTVNGIDLGLLALNQARRKAELEYDFEFQRRLVTLAVDGSTGGDLDDVVLYGTSTPASIKTILEVGVFDENNNLRPVEWTTVAEGLERNRCDNRWGTPRYPSDDEFQHSDPNGRVRYEFANDKVYRFPRDTASGADVTLGMEVYIFSADWVTTSYATVSGTLSPLAGTADIGNYIQYGVFNTYPQYLAVNGSALQYRIYWTGTRWKLEQLSTNDGDWLGDPSTAEIPDGTFTPQAPATGTATIATVGTTTSGDAYWLTYGEQYLLWQSIIQLNHLSKSFVYRQEGNLPPPQVLADQGLAALREWDTMKFEAFRRHRR